MAEIAMDIIEGRACACGQYFEDEAPGIPRYCSSQCALRFAPKGMRIDHARKKQSKFLQNKYAKHLDREFFEAMGVRVVQNQPWQFSLYFEDLNEGKFVWYPGRTGTLMFETENGIYKVGEFFDSEKVFEEIQKKVNAQ